MSLLITIGSIDKAPEVLKVDRGESITIRRKKGVGFIEVEVSPKGGVRVRTWTRLRITPVAGNVIDIEEVR